MELPDKIRPYHFHGVHLASPKNNECIGECPFCDREGKFSVNAETGKWRCWSCAEGTERGGGNVYTFLRKLHDLSIKSTKVEDYKELVVDRGYLDSQCVIEWELCKSLTTGAWLVPGYNVQCQLVSLYQLFKEFDGSRHCKPTPTLGHCIHGMNLWISEKPVVYICEGPWDAMALWEMLVRSKNCKEHGLRPTASRESSLYAQANVIAAPGTEVFFESWLPLFEDKIVNLMYDSDHPRTHPKTGHVTVGAGWRGMKRITEMFAKAARKPQEVNCIYWGEEGYDIKRKTGYDIRDLLTRG